MLRLVVGRSFLDGLAMSAQSSLISDLDETIKSSGSAQRVETLRRVTDLFLVNADRYKPEQVELFDDVLVRLVAHMEDRALAELSRRLAPVDNAPIEVIRTLAFNDAIEVAGPVIESSNSLADGDLVVIASTKSQDHLLAISGRSEIDESVTDVLVERGNDQVARKVAVNHGARLSSAGYATLVERAEHDDELTEMIGQRTDIPPQLFQELVQRATETVQARLLARLKTDSLDGALLTLHKVADEMAKVNGARDYAAAQARVEAMYQEGILDEIAVMEFVSARRMEEVIAALSVLCSSRVDIIERLMQGSQLDALLIPCKAARLTWITVKPLIQLNPCHRILADVSYERMRQDYQKLSIETAQRILRFWQVRSAADVTPA